MATAKATLMPIDMTIASSIRCGNSLPVKTREGMWFTSRNGCIWTNPATTTTRPPVYGSPSGKPMENKEKWWALQDLNLRPTDYESAALTS